MKLSNLFLQFSNLKLVVFRFIIPVLFILNIFLLSSMTIEGNDSYKHEIISLIVGFFASIILQLLYEKYFLKRLSLYLSYFTSIAITIVYYIYLETTKTSFQVIMIRTIIIVTILVVVAICAMVNKKVSDFSGASMSFFKASMQSFLFSLVLFLGLILIIGVFDYLITDVRQETYMHVANFTFILFAPFFFLSLLPFVGNKRDNTTSLIEYENSKEAPAFLKVILSYIIVPIAVLYTLILVLYLIINLNNDFWKNNLLEQLFITYSTLVIILLILLGGIRNKFSDLFKLIFPKVLIPISLLQTISSILMIEDKGLTHTRYLAIAFGVFALFSSTLMSLNKFKKTFAVGIVYIVLSTLILIPPIDLFSVSKNNQYERVLKVLNENNMIQKETITKNGNLDSESKRIISDSIEYLYKMGYTNEISWLPNDFSYYGDFERIFGFNSHEIDFPDKTNYYSHELLLDNSLIIPITNYDYLIEAEIYEAQNNLVQVYNMNNKNISLKFDNKTDVLDISSENISLINIDFSDIRSNIINLAMQKELLTIENASFIFKNDNVTVNLVVKNSNYVNEGIPYLPYIKFYLLISFEN